MASGVDKTCGTMHGVWVIVVIVNGIEQEESASLKLQAAAEQRAHSE